jgi:hypothetical protein
MSLPTFQRCVTYRPDDGDSTDLWNVGKLVPVHMVLQPRREPFYSRRRENLKSYLLGLFLCIYKQQEGWVQVQFGSVQCEVQADQLWTRCHASSEYKRPQTVL